MVSVRGRVNSAGFRAPAGGASTLAPPPPLLIGCSAAGGEEERRGVGDLVLRHFRLLWAAAAVVSECGGELGEAVGGRKAGWAEGGGNPITGAPAWTFPPPPTLSGPIGEGSPPPPARRGAESGSGEATLSARAVVARAGALTWRRLSSGGAGWAARAGSCPGGGERADAYRFPSIPPPPPTLSVFLRWYCYPRNGGARRVEGVFFCAGVPRVPTPGCLSGRWGWGSCPLGSAGRRRWLLGSGGEGLGPTAWRGE